MRLDINKFALAAAGTMGIIYIVCAIFVALLPDFASTLMSWLTHLVNIEPREITLPGLIGGIVQVLIYTYVGALIFASLDIKFLSTFLLSDMPSNNHPGGAVFISGS